MIENKRKILLVVFLTFNLLSSATYVEDNRIVLLRSQFNDDVIAIDGDLTENIWLRAGSVILDYEAAENATSIVIRFANDLDYLYFGMSLQAVSVLNTSASIFFDTDGDGKLSTPEDGKVLYFLNSTLQSLDSYWDGNVWKEDFVQSTTDDFSFASKLSGGFVNFEMKIKLISDNIQYSGWQIASSVNSYISFTTVFTRPLNNVTKIYRYPALPSNATGFVDLKLAGPEDQDLPEYIPPTHITYSTVDTYLNDHKGDAVDALGLDAPFLMLFPILSFMAVAITRRRREN